MQQCDSFNIHVVKNLITLKKCKFNMNLYICLCKAYFNEALWENKPMYDKFVFSQ